MKSSQRLDYSHLTEYLRERGLVDPAVLQSLIQATVDSGVPYPELLLTQDLVSDWELSRIVCEIYGLAFLLVDQYPPTPEALELTTPDFVRSHRLIPLAVHDQTMTVCMPGLVPADVLGTLAAETDLQVLPIVGSVRTNLRWIGDNLPEDVPPPLPAEQTEESASLGLDNPASWDDFFDEADAAVLMDLEPGEDGDPPPSMPDLPQIPEPPPLES